MLLNLWHRRTVFTSGSSDNTRWLGNKNSATSERCGYIQSKQGLFCVCFSSRTGSEAKHGPCGWVPQGTDESLYKTERGNLTVVVFFARWLGRGRRETQWRQITALYWRDAKNECRHLNWAAHSKRFLLFLLNLLTSIHIFPLKPCRPFSLTCPLFSANSL